MPRSKAKPGIRRIMVWIKDAPPEASDEDIAQYVGDALGSMGGCRLPSDPLFGSLQIISVMIGETKFQFQLEERQTL